MLIAPSATTGADPLISALRAREFGRLDRDGLAYLDYTGSALYGEGQVRSHHALLERRVFGNPHSAHGPSRASSDAIEHARAHVLRFLDADPDRYVVCFTANASAAIKLVAESYPFAPSSGLLLSADNHNSVNGVREYARRGGAPVAYIPLDEALHLRGASEQLERVARRSPGAKLLAFPAQSNFSGVQHSLRLVDDAHRLGFDVLLDAAAFVSSNRLSLHRVAAEFVVLSFYKIFGFPTGVGALVVRRDAMRRLRRPWFAGGTVDFASVQHDVHQLRDAADAFEDGTPDFLNIAALPAGFAMLAEVGMARVHEHVMRLTRLLLNGLHDLRRADGQPLVRVYGPRDLADRGGTVAFNVLPADGGPVPYPVVECRARDAGVAVRGGCFCNPGAAEQAFGFEARRTKECFVAASAAGFTVDRFAACLGPGATVGAIRASLGVANNDDDVMRALGVVQSFADEEPVQ